MALDQAKETEILKKLVCLLLQKRPLVLDQVKREIGNIAKLTGETQENIAEVLGPIYQSAIAETFDPENFFKKK